MSLRYKSTRGQKVFSLSEAIHQGLAPDGGLFVPVNFPLIDFEKVKRGEQALWAFANYCLSPFFIGDPLEKSLPEICKKAFDFPAPLKKLNQNTSVLELFHGPTLAFKDFGARFLAGCLSASGVEKTILVATSGDTGGAVASACYRQPGLQVVLLFPQGRVSYRQEQQLTCWGENVRSFAVKGSFDNCQNMVKALFNDPQARHRFNLTSANSINIARLLPQMVYYAQASWQFFEKEGKCPSFVIPTGNMGNAVACFYAKRMGWPIDRIALSTNANKTLCRFYDTGEFIPETSLKTLANAMDVGCPSNFERLRNLYENDEELKKDSTCSSVTDQEIKEAIKEAYEKYQEVFCPHTATALQMRKQLDDGPWIIVSTAHPAKFSEEIEPIIGGTVSVPADLKNLLDKEKAFEVIEAKPEALLAALTHH